MNIVLVEPEIHFNTGNVGRTCVATGTTLHLVGPLGFRVDSKEIRRSGLDYWVKLKLVQYESLEAFWKALPPQAPLFFFSTEGSKEYWDAAYPADSWLVFGKESAGLPPAVRQEHRDRLYRIPVSKDVRSLNVSTAAGIVLYEALRQNR